jgi:diphosphomevalonate decarboxylase
MARLGSGSASRSVYGNYVEWGEHDYGSDEFAHPFSHRIHQTFDTLNDSVLITSSRQKKVSSSFGHKLMDTHPYKEARIEQALNNMERIRIAIKDGEFNDFAEVLENEALSLHAMMLSSEPGFILINQSTIEIIDKIKQIRKDKNIPVTFTLDAGPNVHIIYPIYAKESVRKFINSELLGYCEAGKVFHDFTGNGPERVDKKL